MLYSAFMSALKHREKKDQQMNVRFTAAEIEALDQIAELEDRDRAYLVGFFTRWGMEQYKRVGSLIVLRKKNFPRDPRFAEIQSGAMGRLQLRQEAASDQEERSNGGTSTHATKTTR